MPRDAGMTLVELMVSMTIFTVMLIGFGMLFGASLKSYSFARARTMAEALGSGEIDQARSVAWADLGVKNGNPPGDLVAEEDVKVGTSTFHVTRSVELVDDNIPTYGYGTGANYKRVVITVTSPSMKVPVVYETLVAPPTQPSLFSGAFRAHVSETCGASLTGASVLVADGPSADRTGTTNSTGDAQFSGLKPTNLSAPGNYYNVTPSLAGWSWLQGPAADAQFTLDPGQTQTKGYILYKPATLTLKLVDKLNQPVTSPYSLDIYDLEGVKHTIAGQSPTGSVELSNFDGEDWVPCKSYKIVGSSLGYTAVNPADTQLTGIVGYPGSTTIEKTLQIPIPARTETTFTFVDKTTGLPMVGLAGTIHDTTNALEADQSFTTDANGQVVFDLLPDTYSITPSTLTGYYPATFSFTVPAPAETTPPTAPTPLAPSPLEIEPWRYTEVTFTTRDSITGSPVGDVAVEATGGPIDPVTFTTDAVTGTATVSVVQGTYTLKVTSPPAAYQSFTGTFTASTTTTAQTISLAPMGSVGGVVRDSSAGTTLAGVTVKFSGGPSGTQTFTSATDGTLSAYLLPGTYTVSVNPAPTGYGTFSSSVTVPSGAFSYTVALNPIGSVTVNTKNGVTNAAVGSITLSYSGGPSGSGTISVNGSGVGTKSLQAGTYTVTWAGNSTYQAYSGSMVVTGGTNPTFNVVLWPKATVSAKFKSTNASGGNLSNSSVIKLVGPTNTGNITLPSGGAASSNVTLMPGVYTVTVVTYPSGYPTLLTTQITITTGTTYTVQFGT